MAIESPEKPKLTREQAEARIAELESKLSEATEYITSLESNPLIPQDVPLIPLPSCPDLVSFYSQTGDGGWRYIEETSLKNWNAYALDPLDSNIKGSLDRALGVKCAQGPRGNRLGWEVTPEGAFQLNFADCPPFSKDLVVRVEVSIVKRTPAAIELSD